MHWFFSLYLCPLSNSSCALKTGGSNSSRSGDARPRFRIKSSGYLPDLQLHSPPGRRRQPPWLQPSTPCRLPRDRHICFCSELQLCLSSCRWDTVLSCSQNNHRNVLAIYMSRYQLLLHLRLRCRDGKFNCCCASRHKFLYVNQYKLDSLFQNPMKFIQLEIK